MSAESSKKVLAVECRIIVDKLRGVINQEHSLSLAHIILLPPRTIPKTTSGKITRNGCRNAYLQKTLKGIFATSFTTNKTSFEMHQDHPKSVDPETIRSLEKNEIMKRLTADIGRILSMPPSSVPLDSSMATMMDSLSLSQFKGLLEARYSTRLSDEYLFREGSTINKLVEVVKLGYAPDDNVDGSTSGAGSGGGSNNHATRTCSQAMGCPPGVCCVVM